MPKVNKTCDQCRHRKIGCIVPEPTPGMPPVCVYCAMRNYDCHFSIFRRKKRIQAPETHPSSTISPPSKTDSGDLYIDRLLQQAPQDVVLFNEGEVIKAPDELVPSSALAFFSDRRLSFLSEMTGSSRLRKLIEKLDDIILARLGFRGESPWARIHFTKPPMVEPVTLNEASAYVKAYFRNLHPVYPFLDREQFEAQAFSPHLPQLLTRNPSFSALYHAILALGSQFFNGGSFEPGFGRACELYQVALGHMAEILAPQKSLENLQALAAMSIFALNACCLQIGDSLISQAASLALTLRYHKSSNTEAVHLRTFWVIYTLEKRQSFTGCTSSIIPDEDIGCNIPATPEFTICNFNWFLALIRFSRISSVVYQSLFSVTASLKPASQLQLALKHARCLCEDWRMSIPSDLRPGEPVLDKLTDSSTKLVVLLSHSTYHTVFIALERLTLHLDKEGNGKNQQSRQNLVNTARAIVDLTQSIELQPYLPIFITAVVPLSALFILFDFIIHNPNHYETRANLTHLDTLAGYFSLLDYASKGALPGNLISEFAQIAREYFCRMQLVKSSKNSHPHKDPVLPGALKTKQPTEVGSPGIANAPLAVQGPENLEGMPLLSDGQQSGSVGGSALGPTYNGSDYLDYPTPSNLEVATDMPMWDTGDFRLLFGISFPE